MRNEREKSGIVVTVPSVDAPLKQALKEYNAKAETPATAITTYEFGFVQTKKGMFILNSEGVGDATPITDDNPFEAPLYPEWDKSFSPFPAGELKLTDTEILMLPAKREVPLEDFIRSFGSRLETNYNIWREALLKAEPLSQ